MAGGGGEEKENLGDTGGGFCLRRETPPGHKTRSQGFGAPWQPRYLHFSMCLPWGRQERAEEGWGVGMGS